MPKNNYGNIDLYTPSMLPHGGVHIPRKNKTISLSLSVCVCVLLIYIIDKGIAKIAKKLGFDFAEAVVRQ